MAQYTARKPMTVLGTDYKPGQPVPLDRIEPALRKKLIEQRRVVPDRITVQTGKKN